MRELSLFSGAGGGLLATQHLLKWQTIGYVEIDEYCQKILRQRQLDGFLHKAPIFTDINAFIDSGCAKLYRGVTDVITAGFPCQPWSRAGKKKGKEDIRNLWPQTLRTIQIIKPEWIFLENTSTLLSSYGNFGTILKDLAQSRLNAKWCLLDAWNVGGSFYGTRVFLVASSHSINGKEGMGFYKKYLKTIQQGFNLQSDRQMWLQTINRNARSDNGVAHYVDRGKAVGEGQVPRMVEVAWKVLKPAPNLHAQNRGKLK